MDAESSSVEIFTDVQICIVQCCSGAPGYLCLLIYMLRVSDCHKRFFSRTCKAATTKPPLHFAQICSMTYSKEWIVTSMLSVLFWCELCLSFIDIYTHDWYAGPGTLTVVSFVLLFSSPRTSQSMIFQLNF